jgi:hypothetical protein
MPQEPKIMKMDWKALGYQSSWVDGKLVWEMPSKDKKPDS